MTPPYRIVGLVALTAGVVGLAGSFYIYQSKIAPYRPAATQSTISQPAISEPLEEIGTTSSRQAAVEPAVKPDAAKQLLEDTEYLSSVSHPLPFNFIDAKTGKVVSVWTVASLAFKTEADLGTLEYFVNSKDGGLGRVTINNNETKIEVTHEKIRGPYGGDLGATNSDVWKGYEVEYLRLVQAGVTEARKRYSDRPKQEKTLADLVNQK